MTIIYTRHLQYLLIM